MSDKLTQANDDRDQCPTRVLKGLKLSQLTLPVIRKRDFSSFSRLSCPKICLNCRLGRIGFQKTIYLTIDSAIFTAFFR